MKGDLDNVLAQIVLIKQEVEALEQERKDLQEQAIKMMEQQNVDTTEWEHGSTVGRATVVRPVSIKYDERKLAAALGKKMWAEVTRAVLDEKLLEAKVAKGDIELGTVADCAIEVQRTPYLRVTGGK